MNKYAIVFQWILDMSDEEIDTHWEAVQANIRFSGLDTKEEVEALASPPGVKACARIYPFLQKRIKAEREARWAKVER